MVEKAVRRPEWLGSLGCGELNTGRGSFNHKKTMVSCGFNHVWLLGCWHDQMGFQPLQWLQQKLELLGNLGRATL